jgi:2',3'-cyclic-nucleotide 2'-phosphodiesterase (5'-nucleotidase family)
MYRHFLYTILIVLAASCRPSKIVKAEDVLYPMKYDTLGIDSVVYKMILPYKTKVDGAMGEHLVNAAIEFPAPDRKNIAGESLLGNMLTDIFLSTGRDNYRPADGKNIDFVLMNTGGIRTSLPKGVITTRNVFEVLPFDNRLVVVTLSGDSTQALLNYIAKKGGDPVAGMQMGIKEKKPVDVLINGLPFDKNNTYKVLTNDFCATGGDQMWFFTGAKESTDLNIILRDAIITKFRQLGSAGIELNSKLDNRIYKVDAR